MSAQYTHEAPYLAARRRAREALYEIASGIYREWAERQTPLLTRDLTLAQRKSMTVALLRNLADYEAFEFISEPAGNLENLPVQLADYIAGNSDAATLGFQRLAANAVRYSETYMDEILQQRFVDLHIQ